MRHTQVKNGTYSLMVETCVEHEGATVKFSIGDYWAEQSWVLPGELEVLNLHQTNDPVVIN